MRSNNSPRDSLLRWCAGGSAGFSVAELMVVTAIVAILASMAVPSYSLIRRRFFDTAAMSDVLNAGKALEALDPKDARTLNVTVIGPGEVPNLPGARVSRRTQLTVTRSVDAKGVVTYSVQGTHLDGAATYFFQGAKLFAKGATL